LPATDVIATVGGVKLRRGKGETAFFFAAPMAINADGAPKAYHPDGSPPGLDWLANAGSPGNWWGIATDDDGTPFVQRARDPAPGFYVSTTALVHPKRATRDPRRYVNSSRVPFVVLPRAKVIPKAKARLGDLAAVLNTKNGKSSFAIVADIGPDTKIGEGSIALARALGIPHSPRTGGVGSATIAYVIFPASGNGRPRSVKDIKTLGAEALAEWGGLPRLRKAAKR
jgi:hypothetical protein